MSNDNKNLVNFEQFADYLTTLKGEHICPMCLEEQWSLFTPDVIYSSSDKENMIIPTIPGIYLDKDTRKNRPNFLKSESLNLLFMQCKNCGHMIFFNNKKVLKNLESNDYIKKEAVDLSEDQDDSSEK
ncbi:hypothetical protein EYY98_19900 [Obesumbacterium proteus]|nr:hypothetical protein EYY98_19900 [Obesumbacterium proteus]